MALKLSKETIAIFFNGIFSYKVEKCSEWCDGCSLICAEDSMD
jgi:hypothetical protein